VSAGVSSAPLRACPAAGLWRRGDAWQALLSTCPKAYSEESQMKRQRAPYTRRSVWIAIAILSGVLVVGFAVAGYEINHLRTQINGLQAQISGIQTIVSKLLQEILKLGQSGK